jgi:hypothetical protein
LIVGLMMAPGAIWAAVNASVVCDCTISTYGGKADADCVTPPAGYDCAKLNGKCVSYAYPKSDSTPLKTGLLGAATGAPGECTLIPADRVQTKCKQAPLSDADRKAGALTWIYLKQILDPANCNGITLPGSTPLPTGL